MVRMGTVWDRTAEFLSDNLGALLPIVLLALFVPTSISGNFAEMKVGASQGLIASLGIASLLLVLVSFWGQLAIIAMALDPALGRSATGVATRRLPAGIAVMLVLFLLFLLLALPIFIALGMGGYDLAAMMEGQQPQIQPGAAAFVGLYGLFYFVLLLVIAARLAVTMPALVAEQLALGAIPRSILLTRGHSWRIIGVLILYIVLSTVAGLAARFVFGSIFELVAGGDAEGGVSLASVLTSIVVAAVQTGFTAVAAAFTAQLYIALDARHGAAAAA